MFFEEFLQGTIARFKSLGNVHKPKEKKIQRNCITRFAVRTVTTFLAALKMFVVGGSTNHRPPEASINRKPKFSLVR